MLEPPPPGERRRRRTRWGRGARAAARSRAPQGPYSMCYAVSTGPDPFGSYYRYEFLRPLFPDYPRPAIWPDGYYVPTSTGDNPISEPSSRRNMPVWPIGRRCSGRAGHRTVRHAEQRRLPEQRRRRRQGRTPAGRTEHHDGGRRHAAAEAVRGGASSTSGSSRSTGTIRPGRPSRGPRRSRSRPITTCATASSPRACRSRAPIGGSTRRATRSCPASSIAGFGPASRSSPSIR